jgi:hypothetical protein
MRKQVLAFAVLALGASLASADNKPTQATIVSQTSVDCGTKKQGKKESTNILCQQYTVRTTNTEYQIRQQKPGSMNLLQPNTPIEFTLDKDKMKFKANGKKYEFLVVGTSAITNPPAASSPTP